MSQADRSEILEARDRTLVCTRCSNPLRLECFKEMDDEIFEELCHSEYTAVTTEKDDRKTLLPIFNKKLESSVMRKVVLPINIPDITNDFMIVGELSSLPLDNANSLRVTNALYELMSDAPTMEHPMCEDCTDSLLEQMDLQLKSDEDDHKLCQRFLEDYSEGEDEGIEKLEAQLKELKAAEEALEAQLAACEAEEIMGKEMLKEVERQTECLEELEKAQLIKYASLKHKLLSLNDCESSVNYQLMRAETHLNRLLKYDTLKSTFYIWRDGPFGVINGFRLGRLEKEVVEWNEINAAWGQAALLLWCLAKRSNFKFKRYRIVPYGSLSYIVALQSSKTVHLPLYCLAGGISYVLDNKFNNSMVAFLNCLQQFKMNIEESDMPCHLPYKIRADKIHDKIYGYSVRITLNSPTQWTRAMKLLLTNLKWAMEWVSNSVPKYTVSRGK